MYSNICSYLIFNFWILTVFLYFLLLPQVLIAFFAFLLISGDLRYPLFLPPNVCWFLAVGEALFLGLSICSVMHSADFCSCMLNLGWQVKSTHLVIDYATYFSSHIINKHDWPSYIGSHLWFMLLPVLTDEVTLDLRLFFSPLSVRLPFPILMLILNGFICSELFFRFAWMFLVFGISISLEIVCFISY